MYTMHTMKIEIKAFKDGKDIPKEYTCDGKDTMPTLLLKDVPKSAKSLALIIDDPDATGGVVWDHCVVYNIPPETQEITAEITETFSSGLNSWGDEWYGGPCPPKGSESHRYVFKVYALKKEMSFKKPPKTEELLHAMKRYILKEAVYTGLYKRR